MSTVLESGRSAKLAHLNTATLNSSRSLYIWGMINTFGTFLLFLLSPFADVPSLTKFYYGSIVLWLIIAYWTNPIPLRLPLPAIVLTLLQLWYVFTTMYANVSIIRLQQIVMTHYHVLSVVLVFLQAAALSYIAPQSRRVFIKGLMAIATVSAVISVGQFVGIGPLINIGNKYLGFAELTGFLKETETIRASGILPFGAGSILYLALAGYIGAAMLWRKLRIVEIGVIGLFLFSATLPQVRNVLPVVAVCILLLFVLVVRRYKSHSAIIIPGAIVFGSAAAYALRNKFAYVLDFFVGSSGTLEYRRDYLWPQAWNVYEQFPWTGIGVEPAFAGFPSFPDRYVGDGIMDNAYLTALSFGGIPAFTLFLMFVLTAQASMTSAIRRGSTDPERLRYLAANVPFCLSLLIWPVFGNVYTNPINVLMLFAIAGMALPTELEYKELRLDALRRRFGTFKSKKFQVPEVDAS